MRGAVLMLGAFGPGTARETTEETDD
jgi:hypothetical protein